METIAKLQTPFQRYLASIGDKCAAEKLGVPQRTVKSWRLGDRVPRPTQARLIIASMPVSMADIYGETDESAAPHDGPDEFRAPLQQSAGSHAHASRRRQMS